MTAVQRDRAALLLAAALQALAAGGEAFDVFGVDLGVVGLRQRIVLDRRHQRRRVGDGGGFGVRRFDGFLRLRLGGGDRRRLVVWRDRRVVFAPKSSSGMDCCAGAGAGLAAGGGVSTRAGRAGCASASAITLSTKAVNVGRRFRSAGKPGRLAARATHSAPGRAEGGRVDHVGRGAARADDQHGIRRPIWPQNLAAVR